MSQQNPPPTPSAVAIAMGIRNAYHQNLEWLMPMAETIENNFRSSSETLGPDLIQALESQTLDERRENLRNWCLALAIGQVVDAVISQ